MPRAFDYVIVGGGMTAAAAAEAIRKADPRGTIGLISAEQHPPYARPPLSKALWKGEPESSIWKGTDKLGVDLRLGRRAVLGGGFIGSEVAAALRLVGCDVVMLVPEDGIGARVFPAELSQFLVSYYREQGVDVRTGQALASLSRAGKELVLRTTRGDDVRVDAVVAGIGIQPNVELAVQAGLRADNGIVVDEHLQTSASDVFAAGDVANFFNPALGARLRVEHEDNANTMGAAAGRAMAGDKTPYTHLPFFYSDLFALGYEAVGELDPRLETISDWKEPFREGVIYYLKGGRVRGVLLWNTWGQVDAARALIAEQGTVRAEQLIGRLPAAAPA